MRLTIWQLLGIIAALAGAYVVYTYWWIDQDRNSWIKRFNSSVYDSEKEMLEEEEEPDPNAGWL